MADRPNILFCFVDQMRFDCIAALGNPVIKTPQLDRIAREGVAFTSAYTPSPVCVPARCSMTFGQYAAAGLRQRYPFPQERNSFVDVLAANGYRTHGIGKCHFVPEGCTASRPASRRRSWSADKDDYPRGWTRTATTRSSIRTAPAVRCTTSRRSTSCPTMPTPPSGSVTAPWPSSRSTRRGPTVVLLQLVHPSASAVRPAEPVAQALSRAADAAPQVPADHEALHTWVNKHQNRYQYRDQGIDLNLMRNIEAHYYACISFVDIRSAACSIPWSGPASSRTP